MEHDLSVRYAHPDELTIHPNNARKSNLDELKKSLQRNGQYKPVVVSKRTGFIVAGNHTVLALRELGANQVAFVSLDIDENTEHRILVVDNRIGDLGSYDNDLLIDLLESMGGDLGGTGYNEVDLDILRDMEGELPDEEDDLPSAPVVVYGAVVECDTLAEQRQLVAHLRENGLDARPLKRE